MANKDTRIEELSNLLHRWVTADDYLRGQLEMETWLALRDWVNVKIKRAAP